MRTLAATLSFLLVTAAAHAHADLAKAIPAAGTTITSAPQEVLLSFTDRLEAIFSSLKVTDAKDIEVSEGKPEISGNTMRVGLKPLSAGTYKVNWRVMSVDTHKAAGSFTFRVELH